MPRFPVRPRTSHLVVGLVLLVAACQGEGGDPGPTGAATGPLGPGTQVGIPEPDDIDPGRLEPLAGLGPCPSPPAAVQGADTGGLPLPDEAVVTMSSADGALRSVQGFSPRTPVEVMVAYLRLDGWTVLAAEDEVFESEVLLERGDLRAFVKSQATCERGAAFVLFASDDPALVPRPAGTD